MIKLVRLDYRLLHGQIIAAWLNTISVQRIIVVDDSAATDDVKSAALKLSKPAGIKLNILSVARAIAKIPTILKLPENIMLIFGSTSSLVAFCGRCPEIKEIQYGATFNKRGSKQIDESVFLDEEELRDTQELLRLGAHIYSQQTPGKHKVEIRGE